MKAALFVCLLVLAVPSVAAAGDTPSPALDACKAEYLHLGADAFKAKYGANEPYQACVKEHGGTVTAPTPVVPSGPEADCKAEYVKLGADAFKAKYGATEPYQACIHARGGTVAPPKPVEPSGPEAVCKAEYMKLGADAFKAKYGATEPVHACVEAQGGGDHPKPAPTNGLAPRLCELEYKQLGADAFAAKYGAGDAGKHACLQAQGDQAAAIASKCKTADDPEACVKQALGVTHDKPVLPTDAAQALAKTYCAAKAKSAAKEGGDNGKERFAACVKAALPKARALVARCKTASEGNKDAFKQCLAGGAKTSRR